VDDYGRDLLGTAGGTDQSWSIPPWLQKAGQAASQVPMNLARGLYSAATLPGDAALGNVDPRSPEGFQRAMALAGMTTAGAAPATRAPSLMQRAETGLAQNLRVPGSMEGGPNLNGRWSL
jgi:hypothetical protein